MEKASMAVRKTMRTVTRMYKADQSSKHMYLLLFLITSCSILNTPAGGGAMAPVRTRSADHDPYRAARHPQPSKRQRRQLAEPDILNTLRTLISVELEDEDHHRLSDILHSKGKIGEGKFTM